jgi:hypothetical protein
MANLLKIQNGIQKNFSTSTDNEKMQVTLEEIREYLVELKPILKNLSQPRRIVLVEDKEQAKNENSKKHLF